MVFGRQGRRVTDRLNKAKEQESGLPKSKKRTPTQKWQGAQAAHKRIRPVERFFEQRILPNMSRLAGSRAQDARAVFETGIRTLGFSIKFLEQFDLLLPELKRRAINTALKEQGILQRARRLETAIKQISAVRQ